MQYNTLFNPRSVAVIGATGNPSKVGYALMKNILAGSVREVYPVTLGETEVLGQAAYTSVGAIPGPVDLVVIAVRADLVAMILRECAKKHSTAAIVISAGFKEVGPEGKKLEEEIAAVARENGITLLGPNCLGIMNAHADWNASFAVGKPRAGGIAFVSQSGALGTALLDWANREGIGFSKFVSLGNEAALSEVEFMEYLADDTETSAVLLYVEQVADGARFMEAAQRITKNKPLVVLRAGRSARGSAAVASHTGSLAPSDKIFGAALRQVGAIPVDSLRTLFSLAKLFELGLTGPLQRLVILTNGGGPSVNTADLVDLSHSLSLASFTDETKAALREVLPPMAAVSNPIDVIGDAGPDRYENTLRILTTLSDVDAIITLVTPQMMTDPKGIAEVLVQHRSMKPIIPVLMGGATVAPGVAVLQEQGMVNFALPTDVVEALDALARGMASHKIDADTPPAHASATTRSMMPLPEMQELMERYDLHLSGLFVESRAALAQVVETLGEGPYAIKAIGNELVHKSDLKAVRLGLEDVAALGMAWDDIFAHLTAHVPGITIDGMLVQRMIDGVECIVGMKRDSVFGPVIVFGLGGIFVEILKDSSMRIAPVSREEALAQIQEIKGLPLLTGARGREPVKLEPLAEAISSLSQLALEHPEIQEIDFNPIFATPDGAHIVDARMMQ